MEGHQKFQWKAWSQEPKSLKETVKLNWNFQSIRKIETKTWDMDTFWSRKFPVQSVDEGALEQV